MQDWDKYHIIPKNSEKVSGISLTKKVMFPPSAIDIYNTKAETTDGSVTFIFKDTMSFLGSSLEKNTQKLCESNHNFPFVRQSHLCQTRGEFDQEKFDLLLRKGCYPYDAIQTFEDLKMREFPSKEKFHSCLGVGKDIADKDWRHGLKVWKTFECETMMDYRYCKTQIFFVLNVSFQQNLCGA